MQSEKEATMNSKIQKIELVKPIEPKIRESKDPYCSFEVVLELTATPNEKWKASLYKFYIAEADIYGRQNIEISNDLIIVPLPKIPIHLPSHLPPEIQAEIQQQIIYIKGAIEKANTEYEKACQEEIRKKEHDKIAREKQKEELRTLQDELDKISFD